MSGRPPDDEAAGELLRAGEISVRGRLVEASNATLYCSVELEGLQADCVYKPVRGERPLWDFPDGTLAGREVAASLLSQAAGWDLVPPTVLRDGPFGPGMVQLWITEAPDSVLVDVLAPADMPLGWRMVLEAEDQFGRPLVLAHAENSQLKSLAALDVVLNNADRKGSHVLHDPTGRVFGVDHGVCLNTEPKLRTVLWGWAGEALEPEQLEGLQRLDKQLDADLSGEPVLAQQLAEHITVSEVRAIRDRLQHLLAKPVFPDPASSWTSPRWPAIPWPAL